MLHQSAAHKHRVATQRRHAAAGKEMQRRLEPEKILQDVQEAEPFRIVVHKLDAALDDINRFVQKNGVDDLQDVGVRLVFGVEDGDNIASRHFQAQVKLVWLAAVQVVGDQQFDIGRTQLFELFPRDLDGSGVVFAQQCQNLDQLLGIIQIVDFLNRLSIERFLVIGW